MLGFCLQSLLWIDAGLTLPLYKYSVPLQKTSQEEGWTVLVISDSVMIPALITDLVARMHAINPATGQVHSYHSVHLKQESDRKLQ